MESLVFNYIEGGGHMSTLEWDCFLCHKHCHGLVFLRLNPYLKADGTYGGDMQPLCDDCLALPDKQERVDAEAASRRHIPNLNSMDVL